jgi:hypothetical protein
MSDQSRKAFALLGLPHDKWCAECNGEAAYSDLAPAMLSVAVVRESNLLQRIADLEGMRLACSTPKTPNALKMQIVAIISSATSLGEQRVYDLADSILNILPEVASPSPAAPSDTRRVRLAFENIRGNYVGWQDNPNFAVLEAAIAAPPAALQADCVTQSQDGARQVLQQVRKRLEAINCDGSGTITDTLWYSPHETLFDFIDNALAV